MEGEERGEKCKREGLKGGGRREGREVQEGRIEGWGEKRGERSARGKD